jgi:hypothetical protein
MDFNPAAGMDDATFNISMDPNSTINIALNWAEPQGGIQTNLNLYLTDAAGNNVVLVNNSNPPPAQIPIQSTNDNLTTQQAFEFFNFITGGGAFNGAIVIQRAAGAGTPRLKWVNFDNVGSSLSATQFNSGNSSDIFGPTILGHNGTANAETVAAVPFNNSAIIENFSARGPVTHYFGPVNGTTPASPLASPEVLDKPDIAATNRALTTFFGSGNRFGGTSAAAPHAAGVAALQLSANPALTFGQMTDALESTAHPVGAFPHTAAGAGLIDAQAAITAQPKPPPPPIAFTSGPTGTTNNNNPTFTFTVGAHPNTINCSIDGNVAQACTDTYAPGVQPDGAHTVAVTATDFFGQTNTATQSFAVDTTAPSAPNIAKGPKKKSKSNKATFTFSGEPGATFACSLDSAAFAPCTSPANVKVKKAKPKPKKHTFGIEQIDAAANVSAPTTFKWTVVKKKKKHHRHH